MVMLSAFLLGGLRGRKGGLTGGPPPLQRQGVGSEAILSEVTQDLGAAGRDKLSGQRW